MYSPTQQSVFPESAPQKKLTPNLQDKVKYAVHYRNLKLYLKLGLVVNKVHRVLTFKQSPWLKTYIDFNTRQRSLAGNCSFLMNNSVLGNHSENLRNRAKVELQKLGLKGRGFSKLGLKGQGFLKLGLKGDELKSYT